MEDQAEPVDAVAQESNDEQGENQGKKRNAPDSESADAPPKKKPKRTPGMPKEWTPHDDMLLRDAVQNTNDFAKINRNVRFSFGRPNARELEDRWRKLLYDPEVSDAAARAMAALPAALKRVVWSEKEVQVLLTEVAKEGFQSFQHVLEQNRAIFHSSRTARSLEAHYRKIKRKSELEAAAQNSGANTAPDAASSTAKTQGEGAPEQPAPLPAAVPLAQATPSADAPSDVQNQISPRPVQHFTNVQRPPQPQQAPNATTTGVQHVQRLQPGVQQQAPQIHPAWAQQLQQMAHMTQLAAQQYSASHQYLNGPHHPAVALPVNPSLNPGDHQLAYNQPAQFRPP